ncbi:hypothetical protein HanOQP8_Chr10g0361381 [Helianthus annuus]|nr:hypothetical protein HanOQP8_Chr10g0361381 [Helianthus annuus]
MYLQFILYVLISFVIVCFHVEMVKQPNQPATNQPQVLERLFIPKHNQVAILNEGLCEIDDSLQIIRFLRRSRVSYAISTEIQIVAAYMQDFWMIARVNNNMIEATVNDHELVITEEVIQDVLQLGALDYSEICYATPI